MSASLGVSQSVSLASVRNPFSHEVVTSPWDRAEADARQINAKAFDLCCQLICEVAETKRATSLLMHGVAGSGKTHVMARLRTHLQSSPESYKTVFISVRMDAAPSRIWRHFRRCLVNDLLRPWQDSSARLYLILRDRLRERPARRKFIEVAAELGISYALGKVLSEYHNGNRLSECSAWLRGEPLPEDVIRTLGVAETDDADDEQLEEHAHDIVIQLCRLAAPDLVVFCFDQLESLEAFPGDQKGLFAYSKLAAALVDELNNAMVISSIQSVFLDRLDQATHTAHFDRLARNRVDLQPLSWEQGKQLLRSRMDAVQELVAARHGDLAATLWPLDEAELKEEFKGDTCVARKLIHRAKDLFEVGRGRPVPAPPTLPETLAEKLAEYTRASRSAGSTISDDVLQKGVPALLELVGQRMPSRANQNLAKMADVVVRATTGSIPVFICNQENMNALGNRLKKILEETDAPNKNERVRIALLRDRRREIRSTALKCRERLKELEARGAKLVQAAPAVMAALDALREMLADANTGDILYRGDSVAPESVREWLATNVPSTLLEFVEEIANGDEHVFVPKLLDYVNRECIVSVEKAAQEIGVPSEEIAAYAQRNPSKLAYLAGPPAILFRLVAESPEAANG